MTVHYIFYAKIVDRALAVSQFDHDRQTTENIYTKINELLQYFEVNINDCVLFTDRGAQGSAHRFNENKLFNTHTK